MGRDERKHKSRKEDRREEKSRRRDDEDDRRRRRKKHHDSDDDSSSRHERKKKRREYKDDDSHEERRRKRRKRKHRDNDYSSGSSEEEDDRKRSRSSSSRRKEKKRKEEEEAEAARQHQALEIERIGRGRGRGVSNLPAWLVEQQRKGDGLGKSNHHSSSEDEGRKRRKHDSRRKEKKRSSRSSDDRRRHKDKKRDKKEKEKKKAIKRPDKSKMQPMGPVLGRKPDKLMDPVEDYYSYHEHFWVYLYREEGVAFNDMTSEESKEAFERFAKEYNSGNLEQEYYQDKLPATIVEESKTTKHSWSFNNVLTDREKKGLQTVQQGIRQQTEYNKKRPGQLEPPPVAGAPIVCKPVVEAPTFSRKTPEEFQEERRANKRLRDHVRNTQEELQGGPKDFRERQLEKKRQQADRIHGAARQREDAGMELSDSALYGGDDTSRGFENALAKQKARKARHAENRANRIQELQAKEQGRQENMLEMLGLKNIKPGQKITIAPRRDG